MLVAGVPVDDVTMDEAIDLIVALVRDGRTRGVTHQVATVNVDFVVNALRDESLMSILRDTSLAVPDGMPVVWAARALGVPMRERVAGADLVPALVGRAAQLGLDVVLYGAGPGIADRASALQRREVPGAVVLGDAGPPDADAVRGLDELGAVINSGPDICCVAFGNPKQERFIARFGAELGIPVMIGVGGTLDFLVGTKRRAPRWMHRLGVEWLHRALSEPRRLVGRYLRDARYFFPAVARQARLGRGRDGGEIRVRFDDDGEVDLDLTGAGALDNRTSAQIVSILRSARRRGATVRTTGIEAVETRGAPGLIEVLALFRDRPDE